MAPSAKLGGCNREKERLERGHRACYNYSLLQGRPETAKMTPMAMTATQPGPEITSSRQTYFMNLFHFPWKLPPGLTGHICTQGLSALLLVCAVSQTHFTHEQGSQHTRKNECQGLLGNDFGESKKMPKEEMLNVRPRLSYIRNQINLV